MNFFTFTSQKDDSCVGFSTDEKGANLPCEFAPWVPYETWPIPSDILFAMGSDAVNLGLAADGFYVMHIDPPNVVRPVFGRRSAPSRSPSR
jgi:hypothetical protein